MYGSQFCRLGGLVLVSLSLMSCSSLRTGQVDMTNEPVVTGTIRMDEIQLLEHQDKTVEAIVNQINNKFAGSGIDYPRVKIGWVRSGPDYESNSDDYESINLGQANSMRAIKSVLESVNQRLYRGSSSKQTLNLDLRIDKVYPEKGSGGSPGTVHVQACLVGNLLIGNIAMFGGFVMCPQNLEYQVIITAYPGADNKGKSTEITGFGSSKQFELIPEGIGDPPNRAGSFWGAFTEAYVSMFEKLVERDVAMSPENQLVPVSSREKSLARRQVSTQPIEEFWNITN